MKLIEKYRARQQQLEAQMQSKPSPMGILELQEINYRIYVLDTIRLLSDTAPKSVNMKALVCHYQLTSGYLQSLITSNTYGSPADEALKKKRLTATASLTKVIADGCKRFKDFKAEDEESYTKRISALIISVLDMWVPYRNSFTEVNLTEQATKGKSEEESGGSKPVNPELSLEERYKLALKFTCPATKYKGKTLGDLVETDPKFISWLATKYKGNNDLIAAALTICEYSEKIA